MNGNYYRLTDRELHIVLATLHLYRDPAAASKEINEIATDNGEWLLPTPDEINILIADLKQFKRTLTQVWLTLVIEGGQAAYQQFDLDRGKALKAFDQSRISFSTHGDENYVDYLLIRGTPGEEARVVLKR